MFRLTLVFLSATLFLLGCQKQPEALPSVRVGYSPHDHHAALYIAAQLPDYFRQQGGLSLKEIEYKKHYQLLESGKAIADITLHSSVGGGQLIRKLHEKQVDMVLGGVPAMIEQIDSGSQLKIVAPLMSEGAALVLAKDFPADSWQSFVAAAKQTKQPFRIGYKIQTSAQNLIFEQALEAEGISFSREQVTADAKVVVRNLFGAKNLIPALQNGLIDGFVIMQPFAALAEYQQLGKTVAQLRDLPPYQQWQDHPCCAMAANGALLAQQRELLTKLVTLLLRANRYLQQEPEKGAMLISRWLGQPLQVEELSLPTIQYLVDYPVNWHSGVEYWVAKMDQQGEMPGVLKAAAGAKNIEKLIYDMNIYDQARGQLERE